MRVITLIFGHYPIFLDKGGVDEILVPLVDVFGAAAGSGVNGVNDDIEDHLANQGRPVALGHEHGEVQEGTNVEDSEHGRFGNEICFATKSILHRQLHVRQSFAFQNDITVTGEFWTIIFQIILNSSDGHLKKCGDLLLEDHGFAFEWNTLNSRCLLDFSDGVAIVQDVLAVNFRSGEVFAHVI